MVTTRRVPFLEPFLDAFVDERFDFGLRERLGLSQLAEGDEQRRCRDDQEGDEQTGTEGIETALGSIRHGSVRSGEGERAIEDRRVYRQDTGKHQKVASGIEK